MDWHALGVGFAFYLILEGVMPLLNPQAFKRTLALVLLANPSHLRLVGAAAMTAGVGLLYLLKQGL